MADTPATTSSFKIGRKERAWNLCTITFIRKASFHRWPYSILVLGLGLGPMGASSFKGNWDIIGLLPSIVRASKREGMEMGSSICHEKQKALPPMLSRFVVLFHRFCRHLPHHGSVLAIKGHVLPSEALCWLLLSHCWDKLSKTQK